jgi:hypothetical protein
MSRVGFESMIAQFELENTFHSLDPVATAIGHIDHYINIRSLLDSDMRWETGSLVERT